jgi:putative transposase
VHLVFSTKERRKIIPKESQARLWAYLAGVCKSHRIFVHEIGGIEDHVHMLIEIPLTLAFSDAINQRPRDLLTAEASSSKRRALAFQ